MATVRDVQQRLISLGYDVGPSGADGIPHVGVDRTVGQWCDTRLSDRLLRYHLEKRIAQQVI
ncbi:hypothetical protein [Agrobacterium sp. CFBP2214]|uniref:peptidoglycan-binding domain-containing protein n=1 Tax=Agrobacterium sp. CFBP2214 TaxID=3040274 RepID=UPI00254A8687|nr:hypothetical protein [Agrobacterium sp. CFBP2214]